MNAAFYLSGRDQSGCVFFNQKWSRCIYGYCDVGTCTLDNWKF